MHVSAIEPSIALNTATRVYPHVEKYVSFLKKLRRVTQCMYPTGALVVVVEGGVGWGGVGCGVVCVCCVCCVCGEEVCVCGVGEGCWMFRNSFLSIDDC